MSVSPMSQSSPLEVLTSYSPHDYTLHGLYASRVGNDPGRPLFFFEDHGGEVNAVLSGPRAAQRIFDISPRRLHDRALRKSS